MTSALTEAGNLPVARTTFVGRRHEVAEIRRILGTTRLLTLTGVGGVGKTRLALEAATEYRKAFPDGTWLVDLAPVRDPAAVAGAAATAVGGADMGTRPALEWLTEHMAARRALIVLDNCEHLADACADLADALLSAGPGLRVLATSRKNLGTTGEHVFTVLPLSVPDEAIELLRDRATAVRPEFRITDPIRAQATRLCDELDGLPLAIELAASRLRTLTVQQIADRLVNRFTLLTGGSRTARPHQRTLHALIDWSYELCSPTERLLWNRLSIFSGGFDLDAVESVCPGEGIAAQNVLDLLDRLVSQSVVLTTEVEGLPRYRLLETIRQFARERLTESGEEQVLLRRHRDHYSALAERLAEKMHGHGQEDALTLLRVEHANLLVALAHDDDPQAGLALAAALRFHWCVGGFLGEGRRQLDRALTAGPEPTPVRARALWAAAWVALFQGDHATADRWLTEADELGRQLDDRSVAAQVMGLRGMAAVFRGQLEEAVPLYEQTVTALTAAEGEAAAVHVLFQLTVVLARLRDPRAAETGRRAVALAREHGDGRGHAFGLWALGYDAWVRGNHEAGLELTRAALETARRFHDPLGAALMLELLAWLHASLGDHEQAGRVLGAVRGLWRSIGTGNYAFGPMIADYHVRCEESVARALGPAAYEEALSLGDGHDTPGRAISFALGSSPETTTSAPAPNPLTRREREVAALVAQGKSNREIAATLVLSRRTVDGHVENIRAKLGFGSRAQIAAWWAANEAKAS